MFYFIKFITINYQFWGYFFIYFLFFYERNCNEQIEMNVTVLCSVRPRYLAREIIKPRVWHGAKSIFPNLFIGTRELDHYSSRVPVFKITPGYTALFTASVLTILFNKGRLFSYLHLSMPLSSPSDMKSLVDFMTSRPAQNIRPSALHVRNSS